MDLVKIKKELQEINDWKLSGSNNTATTQTTFKFVHYLSSITSALLSELSTIQATNAALNSQVDSLKTELNSLKNAPATKKSTPSLAEIVLSAGTQLPSATLTNEQVTQMHLTQVNSREAAHIANNVIISGVDHDESDTNSNAITTRVLEKLGSSITDVERYARLPNKDKTPSNRIVVTFKKLASKLEICRKAPELRKDSNFKGIYVNSDLTKAQRAIEHQLRQARNEKNQAATKDTDNINNGRPYFKDDKGKLYHWVIRSGALQKFYFTKEDRPGYRPANV